jgi:serine/threonine-protein kinase
MRELGTHLAGYELVRPLAAGGMADIYLARQPGLGRFVAVKVLSHERAADRDSCALFMDEARLVGMLDHPNLASVHDVDTVDGIRYLAMEYVDGADLRQLLEQAEQQQRAIDFDCALTIVAGAAAGLDHAHRRCAPDGRPLRLVHRDVSLSNIMVNRDGAVKVIDFGIASSTASVHRTAPGIVRGKASYMSPEQCTGGAVDHRTDVFALGVVLYELTTGRRCFNGNSDFERMLAVVSGNYAAPSSFIPDFPRELERVIRKALATDVDERHASCEALIEALERVAAQYGWTLGTRATARMMRQLWCEAAVALAPVGETTTVALPLTVEHRRRAPVAASSTDADDDAPTRGRRSLGRISYYPLVAA